MIFYNPIFPPFLKFPSIPSTNNNHTVNKNTNPVDFKNACNDNFQKNNSSNLKNISNNNSQKNNSTNLKNISTENKKNNCKKAVDLGFFYNYFNDSDSLIIIVLLIFLYSQDVKDLPLMFCLLLLLIDI